MREDPGIAVGRLPEADVEHTLLSGRSRAEAGGNLVLVDPKALGSTSGRPGAITTLELRAYSDLCLVTRVLQNLSISTERRLGEGWRGSH
jgi:hypothetical protein